MKDIEVRVFNRGEIGKPGYVKTIYVPNDVFMMFQNQRGDRINIDTQPCRVINIILYTQYYSNGKISGYSAEMNVSFLI